MINIFHRIFFFFIFLISLFSCDQKKQLEMIQQSYFKIDEANNIFSDGSTSRPLVPGTIPRNSETYYRYMNALSIPFPVTTPILKIGQEKYQIFCQNCHGSIGLGDGMIVQRGFLAPPSFHSIRLRQMSDRQIFMVITKGFGAMASYQELLTPFERWAVVSYIRQLQVAVVEKERNQNDDSIYQK